MCRLVPILLVAQICLVVTLLLVLPRVVTARGLFKTLSALTKELQLLVSTRIVV